MENKMEKKYDIIREVNKKEILKIFFMGIKENGNIPNSKERFVGVIGYDHEEAIKAARDTFIVGTPGLLISHGDYETIDNILKVINFGNNDSKDVEVKKVEDEKEETTKEQFINRLKLVAEEMVDNVNN